MPSAIGFNGYVPMPIRHGLTLGELARLFNGEKAHRRGPHRRADEELAPRRLVRRHRPGVGRTRRRTCATWWRRPSIRASARSKGRTSRSAAAPTRRSSSSARRGSTARRWRPRSTRSGLPGVRFYPVTFTPAAGAKLGGQACHGVFVIVTDRDRLRPVRVGLEIAATLSRLLRRSSSSWKTRRTCSGRRRCSRESAPATIRRRLPRRGRQDEAQWRLTRAKYLLYD